MKLSFKSKKYALIAIIVAVLVAFFVCFFLWRVLSNKPLQEEEEKRLEIFSPADSQLIGLDYNLGEYSIEVAGKSSFFTTSTRAKVLDDNGEILAEAVLAPSLSLLAKRSFAHVFKIRGLLTQGGIVRVYEENIATGSVVQETDIPIIFEAEALWGTPEFKASEKVFFPPDFSGQDAYYLRDGNIWHFDISDKDNIRKQVFLDKTDDISTFAFAPDREYIAYVSKTYPGIDSGDTISLYSIKTGEEVAIYENTDQEYPKINSILFSIDSKILYFSNGSVWAIDLLTRDLEKFDMPSFSFREIAPYYLEELSLDGSLLIIKGRNREWFQRSLLDTRTKKVVDDAIDTLSFGPSTRIYGFFDNETFLGFYDSDTVGHGGKINFYEINLYNLNGEKKREIFTTSEYPFAFCNQKEHDCYICIGGCSKGFYQIDKNTYELVTVKKNPEDILVISEYHHAFETEYILWLTDTNYSNPILIDGELESNLIEIVFF